ncbi:MAG: hypothetical protein CMN76_02740 [Spirochaetaceae bacterium]|nr:hypothetical protein [Spirochaetaceae bacterium]
MKTGQEIGRESRSGKVNQTFPGRERWSEQSAPGREEGTEFRSTSSAPVDESQVAMKARQR